MNPDPLFKPFTCKSLNLANRVVMAPMGRKGSTDGVLAPTYPDYYRRRVEGGAALIIGEATAISDPTADGYAEASRLHGEAAVGRWSEVVRQVHAAGGAFAPQLWHAGAARFAGTPPVELASRSPSGFTAAKTPAGDLRAERFADPMSEAEIAAVIEAYARTAATAKRIGCDALELHGAHGYLIDQFLWPQTNRRSDDYNGDIVARARFGVEVVRAVRATVGEDFPIIFRFSQWKMQDFDARVFQQPDDLARFLEPLADAGVDIFHASTRRYWEPEFEGSSLNLAAWGRKLSGKPAITVGSVGLDGDFTSGNPDPAQPTAGLSSIDRLLESLERNEFDLVAIGRALISNPDWPNLVRQGRTAALKPFNRADAAVIA